MRTLGIDPGLTGGYIALNQGRPGERIVPYAQGMLPVRGKDVCVAELAAELLLYPPDLVVLERVASRGKDGVKSMFTFGKVYGQLMAMAQIMQWPLLLVNPQQWKKVVLTGTDRTKEATCAYVSMRFPTINLRPDGARKDRDGIADAACLAEYGYLYHEGRTVK